MGVWCLLQIAVTLSQTAACCSLHTTVTLQPRLRTDISSTVVLAFKLACTGFGACKVPDASSIWSYRSSMASCSGVAPAKSCEASCSMSGIKSRTSHVCMAIQMAWGRNRNNSLVRKAQLLDSATPSKLSICSQLKPLVIPSTAASCSVAPNDSAKKPSPDSRRLQLLTD